MVNAVVYMLRDKSTGRWHNWGGMCEWIPDNASGGTIWREPQKDEMEDFVKNYKSCDIEIVSIHMCEVPLQ